MAIGCVDQWHRAYETGWTPAEKVLAVGGSPRKEGNSDVLVKRILQGVTASRVATSRIHLRDISYQGCIGCERCRKDRICTGLKDGMAWIYQEILAARGLVLVSPTHNYNITAWMKAFIDRLYCFYVFDDQRPRGWSSRLAGQGRKAVLAAVCEQENQTDMGFTIDAMKLPLEALGYDVVGTLSVFGVFDRGKVRQLTDVVERARHLGVQLAEAMRTTRSSNRRECP